MGRMTRAKAAEVAERLHVDEEAVLEANENSEVGFVGLGKDATPEKSSAGLMRAPLGVISPNSADGKDGNAADANGEGASAPAPRKKRNRKGKRERRSQAERESLARSLAAADDDEAAGTNADEDVSQSMSPAVRLTRSQLAKQNELDEEDETNISEGFETAEGNSTMDNLAHGVAGINLEVQPEADHASSSLEIEAEAATERLQSLPASPSKMSNAPTSPPLTAVPNVIANLRKDTPGKRSTSNKENVQPFAAEENTMSPVPTTVHAPSPVPNYDTLEAAVVDAASPVSSRRASSMRSSTDRVSVGELMEEMEVEEPVEELKVPEPQELKESSGDIGSEAQFETPPENTESAVEEVAEESPAEEVAEESSVEEIAEPLAEIANQASPETHEEPIVALDDLNDDVEKVSTEVAAAPALAEKQKAKKVAPVVRTTKATQARLSMALADKPTSSPSLGRPRLSTSAAPKPSSSTRTSYAPTLARTSSTSTRPTPPTKKPTIERERTETIIPHSKARPISMSFPAPAPTARSTKPVTKASFQLPGEAIAAKLKAQREERQKREEEEAQKKTVFKARPVPSNMSKTVPVIRHTNASKFRASFAGGAAATDSPSTHKRASSVFTAPTRSFAASTTASSRRPETALNVSKPRASIASAAPVTAGAQRVPSATSKGKEVFSRFAKSQAEAEREKREKEAAAKNARAEAAERGRAASREWAEKKRLREEREKKRMEGVVEV